MLPLRSSCFFLNGQTVFSRRIEGELSAHDDYLSFKSAEISFDIPLSKIKLAYAFEGIVMVRLTEKIDGRKAIAFYPMGSSVGKPKEVIKDLVKAIGTLGIGRRKHFGSIENYETWQDFFKENGLGVKGL